jgi:ATP-dependent helicase/nuclease subunit B
VIKHVYLGWEQPFLPSVANWLLTEAGVPLGVATDLRQVWVLLSGSRYGRTLKQALATGASAPVLPPELCTPGDLGARLAQTTLPLAGPVSRRLAWVQALGSSVGDSALFPGYNTEDPLELWKLAGRLERLQVAVAAGGYPLEGWRSAFSAEAQGIILDHSGEPERWDELGQLEQRYLAQLAEHGLADPQAARLKTQRLEGLALPRHIVLAGVSTLSPQLKRLLDLAVSRGVQCTALLFAEQAFQGQAGLDERFDSYGCVQPQWWQRASLPLQPEQIEVVEDPSTQAQAVLTKLCALDEAWTTADVVIGVADPTVDPHLHEKIGGLLDSSGEPLAARSARARSLSSTSVHTLISGVSSFGQTRSVEDFAALLLHPDLLQLNLEAPLAFDRYRARHQPELVTGHWRAATKPDGSPDRYSGLDQALLIEAFAQLQALFGGIWSGPARSLADWVSGLRELILGVYGEQDYSPESGVNLLLEGLDALLAEGVPDGLWPERLPGGPAVAILLDALSGRELPSAAAHEAIELLQWLELPLDDAPVLIITGMNDGLVPAKMAADPFLPNRLKRALGLETDALRLAREKFALSAMLHSRRGRGLVHCIAGRQSAAGDPLLPSRLLLAVPEDQLGQRVLQLCGEGETASQLAQMPWSDSGSTCLPKVTPLPRPRLEAAIQGRGYSVTDFGAYLRCPYNFALERLLRLESYEEGQRELSPADFGSLIHDVLERFGRDPEARDLQDPEAIGQWLSLCLDTLAESRFGQEATLELQIQLEQVRGRLASFAHFQAERRAEGWRIESVEQRLEGFLVTDGGRKIGIKGRLDRVDRHLSGAVDILDYKTSNTAKKAASEHVKDGEWLNLQLPLCRYLWEQQAGATATEVHTGYFSLPREQGGTCISRLPLDDTALASALEAAIGIVEKIEDYQFEPSDSPFRGRLERLRGFGTLQLQGDERGGDE